MEVMTNVMDSALWVAFLCILCPAKRGKAATVLGSLLAVLFLLVNISAADYAFLYSKYTFLGDFIITFLFAMIFLKGAWYWKVFLILLYNILLMGCNFLGVNFLLSIFHTQTDEMIPADGAFRIALIVVSKGLLLAVFLTACKLRQKIKGLQDMGFRILLIPILTNAIGLILMQCFARFYTDTADAAWLIWLIILISLSFFVFFKFAYDAYRGEEEKKISELLRAQIAIQQEVYEQQYQNVRQVRKHQHDIKHKLVVIEQMLLQGEYAKAQSYTRDYLTELENINAFKYGDSVLSTLLLLKEESARKYGVQWEVHIPDFHIGRMSEMDLCVVLGNLLDNAMEAEKKLETGAAIRVDICEKQMLYICVENVVETNLGKVNYGEATSKENEQLHGFGIPRIRELVEKYHGEMKMTIKEGWFRTEIYI